MRYKKFTIQNYKGIKSATIDLTSEGLVLLLGINESGKTSILRAIESFDHTNDVVETAARARFYNSIRNKKELDSKAVVSAELLVDKKDKDKFLEILTAHITQGQPENVKKLDSFSISRTFNYKDAEFVNEGYTLGDPLKSLLTLANGDVENILCKSLLNVCPSVQYFEDFKDQIPDFISLETGAQWFDPDWASTVEGLFFHADPKVPVVQFQSLANDNARQTILNKVNSALNKQFTDRWNKKLKGVKSIHKVELVYSRTEKLFTFKIVGADGVTVFSIDERSKGALWYFTFLLKTEFKKKKLRAELGKTLYLIDEPGSNLHSSAQINMVTDFRTLASDSNVIYTTHSQYLIDKANLSNVYIVECVKSIVKTTKYQEYLQGKNIQTSYYQPIIDALEIQPFSLDVPWKKVMIVEGIYDYCGFKVMFEMILKQKLDFVIMPGTGATSLETLISLHVGWGAKLFVLLDYDNEGRASQKTYSDKFPALEKRISVLDFLDGSKNLEFEGLFKQSEIDDMCKVAGFTGVSSKKVFQQALANILNSPELGKKAEKVISDETKRKFNKILQIISKTL